MILPTSYIFLSQDLVIDERPAASGGSSDVFEGKLGSSKVYVKRVRVYARDGPQKAGKVYHIASFHTIAKESVDPLPRGCNVETFGTQKYCPSSRHHHGSSPTHLKMDGRGRSEGIYRKTSKCKPAWLGKHSHSLLFI